MTLLVLKWLKFKEVRTLQSWNIPSILITLLVSKLLTSMEVRLVQPLNIPLILVTFDVFQDDKSSVLTLLQL